MCAMTHLCLTPPPLCCMWQLHPWNYYTTTGQELSTALELEGLGAWQTVGFSFFFLCLLGCGLWMQHSHGSEIR